MVILFKFLLPFQSYMLTNRGRPVIGSDWFHVYYRRPSWNSFLVEKKVGGLFQWQVCLFSTMDNTRSGHVILPSYLHLNSCEFGFDSEFYFGLWQQRAHCGLTWAFPYSCQLMSCPCENPNVCNQALQHSSVIRC